MISRDRFLGKKALLIAFICRHCPFVNHIQEQLSSLGKDYKDLRDAIDRALNNLPPITEQKPSIGCNIKWKPGNEPDYFK